MIFSDLNYLNWKLYKSIDNNDNHNNNNFDHMNPEFVPENETLKLLWDTS